MERVSASEPAEVFANVGSAVAQLLQLRCPAGRYPPRQGGEPRELYQAACRFVLRLVVVLFAEGRGLFPTTNALYESEYGLGSLQQALRDRSPSLRAATATAWPRLLRLFSLVHQGPSDPRLPMPAYGGELFRRGDPCGELGAQAMALLESPAEPPSDEAVHTLLALLTHPTLSTLSARRRVPAALDFAVLPSEYLGFCYEGLLDYELGPGQLSAAPTLLPAGGTRKGRGTFYTRPQLTVPAVRRTLEPLLFDLQGRVRTPEQLLALTVCDPAMGCGAFLLAALRVLTEAVVSARGVKDADANSPIVHKIRREVAERCLYGVDLDPLAVELARLALWIETRDPQLPFTFIDDKLRCGDALVGAFREQLDTYPLPAWDRQSPAQDSRGKRPAGDTGAKKLRQLRAQVRAEHKAQHIDKSTVRSDHCDAELRPAYDVYCALWFWPLSQLDDAPRPGDFRTPTQRALQVAQALAQTRRFFHWQLEFPEVFASPSAGFDAIVANPPWEIGKPSSQEFFSAVDPLYRSYGKQQALSRQRELFADDAKLQRQWLDYAGTCKDTANFMRHAYHHQGAVDLNSYKLFVEQAHRLLRVGGQLGMVTPSGLYTDKGTYALRRLLLTRCAWRILYGFQNEKHFFRGVHHAFKQCLIVAQKSPPSGDLQVMFRIGVGDSPAAPDIPLHLGPAWQPVGYPLALVQALSPQSLALIELRSQRDLDVLTKIYASSILLGDRGPRGFGIRYTSELHMTSDSHLFIPLHKATQAGYKKDAYGRFIGPQGDVLLPLYQGIMFYDLAPSVAQYQHGAGHSARWQKTDQPGAPLGPQFLVPAAAARHAGHPGMTKVAFRTLSNAANERTLCACLLPDLPCGNSIGLLSVGQGSLCEQAFGTACLGSLVYDFTLRQRIGGTNINFCFLQETGWPADGLQVAPWLLWVVLGLCFPAWRYAPQWLQARPHIDRVRWAETPHERLRLRCILDATIAAMYGLCSDDLRFILRDCDHPKAQLADPAFCRTLDPKGFWRSDRDKDPELRHPVLTLIAFAALEKLLAEHSGNRQAAIAAFMSLHDGQGWMLPDTLCLAEQGLGHDARALKPQPVQQRLGERLRDWQLAQSPEQSFTECERQAMPIPPDQNRARKEADT